MRTRSPGTRERIFDAAAGLFAVQRFHEVRMDDIAAEAGVSKGTLYRYFHDKEDLYYALIATASKQLLSEVEARTALAASPQAKLEGVLGAIIDFFDHEPYFFDLVQHVEALQSPNRKFPWAQTRKEFLARVTRLLEEGSAAGEFSVPDSPLCALMLLGSVRALIRFGKRPRPPQLARQIVETVLYGASHGCSRTTPQGPRPGNTASQPKNGKHSSRARREH